MKADIEISIHAPREGCDVRTRSPSWWASDFNPRTPRGVRRLKSYLSLALDGEFQSTHPARGATEGQPYFCVYTPISIHAPREGCDFAISQQIISAIISIHAPREGCDSKLYQRAESLLGSICLFAQGEEG